MLIASVILLPYALLSKKLRLPEKKLWIPIIGCGLLFATDISIWNLSIQYSSATQATLLANLSPVWIGIALFLFFPEKPKRQFWAGTVIALFGMAFLMGKEVFLEMKFDKGFLMAIGSGILYAMYIMLSKKILAKLDILSFMIYSMTIASIYLFFICIIFKAPLNQFNTSIWTVFFINGLICQLLGWFAINFSMQKIAAQRISLSLLSQSLVTALMAWLFLNETISLRMIIGGIIILCGIAYTFKKEKITKNHSSENTT